MQTKPDSQSQNENPLFGPVLIIGGGLVGLTLAQALRHRQIPYIVFERSSDCSSRGSGWAVTIHWGLPILASLVPLSIINSLDLAAVNPSAEKAGERGKFAFYNLQTGVARFETPAATRRRLRRQDLQQILLDGIDVRWSKRLVNSHKLDDGRVAAEFADGSVVEGSLIVGCDGAHSAVRSSLLGQQPKLHQIPFCLLGVTAILPTAVVQPMRDLDPYFLQGGDPSLDVFMYFSFLDTPTNNNRANSDTYTCQIIISWPPQSSGLSSIPESAAERLELIRELSSGWAAPFSSILSRIPEESVTSTIKLEDWSPLEHVGASNSLPIWRKSGPQKTVNATLAGDAAHLMTQYRGDAFNHGLRDIESLLHAIEPVMKDPQRTPLKEAKLKSALDAYEAEMCARGAAAVMDSRLACEHAHCQSRINSQSPLVARRVLK